MNVKTWPCRAEGCEARTRKRTNVKDAETGKTRAVALCDAHRPDANQRETERREAIGTSRRQAADVKAAATGGLTLTGDALTAWRQAADAAAMLTLTSGDLDALTRRTSGRYAGDAWSAELARGRAIDAYVADVARDAMRTGETDAARAVARVVADGRDRYVARAMLSGDGRSHDDRQRESYAPNGMGDAGADAVDVASERETIARLAWAVVDACEDTADALAVDALTIADACEAGADADALAIAWDALLARIASDDVAREALASLYR